MAKKRSRRRVPEVLWRLFHNKARTLADTILSLIPSPPLAVANCRCKGRRCLGCMGDKAMSYLLRPKDPSDYRKLLTQCFVVVPDGAPPLSGFDPHNRWPQLEVFFCRHVCLCSYWMCFCNLLEYLGVLILAGNFGCCLGFYYILAGKLGRVCVYIIFEFTIN